MKKLDRQHALESFRKCVEGVLISSDLSARGLDIDDIDQVINMDFPHDPLTYVHRVGRTGRGNASGAALSFVSDSDEAAIRIYKRDLGVEFTEVHFAGGAVGGVSFQRTERFGCACGLYRGEIREKARGRETRNGYFHKQ